jgi:UDP-N-acetylmuramate dehydrogenase
MMMTETRLFAAMRGTLTRNAPLAPHTSWRAGGAARTLYVPADGADLVSFVAQLPMAEPLLVIGLGSNLLVRDAGFRGTVILMHNPGAAIALEDGLGGGVGGGLIRADAGLASPKLARFAAMNQFAGAEFMAGIPGTIGGALAMNAGCYGGETWRHVVRVEVLLRDGRVVTRSPGDYRIGYRTVRLLDGEMPEGVFTAASFRFPGGDTLLARARIKELLARRIATQPLALPNAGSVFRNPPDDHAARLIEACGLKGHVIGGAQVSQLHANFIVNRERSATAADIENLIAHVRETVWARTGVDLEPEVRIVGERQP